MDMDEVSDIVDELYETLDRAAVIDALRERADALAHGEEGRAEFLSYLAGQLEVEDRLDEAEAAYTAAIDDGGPTFLHPAGGLLSVAATRKDHVAVTALQSQLWSLARERLLGESDFEYIGETFEEYGDLRQAMRWFTVPLSDYDPDEIESIPIVASNGRFRVRRALGLPHDRYDEAAALVSENQRHRPLED